MKKVLLSAGLLLCTLAGYADGIPTVGANIVIAPASQWDPTMKWEAKTLVITEHQDFGDPHDPYYPEELFPEDPRVGTGNPNYNMPCWNEDNEYYKFLEDNNGKKWYEFGYDESLVMEDVNFWDPEDPEKKNYFQWTTQQAPFSNDEYYKSQKAYRWTSENIMADFFIRRTFTTDRLLSGDVYLACGHDDAPCEYYINGVLVFQKTGYELNDDGNIKNGWNNEEVYKLTEEQKALIKLNGEENLLCVHVHQNWGGAFADCGLYTMVEGGLPMGYVEAWTGKTLFNSWGGWDGETGGLHGWEKLYEAQADDVYSIQLGKAITAEEEWRNQVHFKTPIRIEDSQDYTLNLTLKATSDIEKVVVKITENDNDENELNIDEVSLSAGSAEDLTYTFTGPAENMKIVFDFRGAAVDSTVVEISQMSLVDGSNNELWIGGSYFNYMYNCEPYWEYSGEGEERDSVLNYRQVKDCTIEGRVETLAWTLPEFDDTMWDDKLMPIGNKNYHGGLENSVWPGNMRNINYEYDGDDGRNTNMWIRRTFELESINPRLSYALNVCHDDTYWTYVNGHLLQNYDGWTDGKNPVQVHIPAKYLKEGKNVIATYIQQNWGGRFYDCGINVEEVNYPECKKALEDAIALAEKEGLVLTSAMKAELAALAAAAKEELANNPDAAEIKEYARVLTENVKRIQGYEGDVKVIIETIEFLKKENNGFGGYADKALANAVNYDTCTTAAQLNDIFRPELRVARKRNAAERRTEKYTGLALSELEEGLDFYLYNVGCHQFLKGTESWGCHQGVGYASNAFTLEGPRWPEEGEPTPYETENTYRINTHRNNGGNLEYMNWGGYVDTDTNDGWQFIPVEGKTNVFHIVQAGRTNGVTGGYNYLGLRDGDNQNYVGFNNFNVVDTDMRTPELETNQWMVISPEEMNSFVAGATKENPADLTHLLVNPCFDQRLSIDEWQRYSEGGACQ
ncbi:MAG: hypothetical protein HUK03_00320, partial [Bacteroidaceae bacterium]|nr:hypothetical protein [Bacteroidaceae bacterium]